MDKQLRADLIEIAFYIRQDAARELEADNKPTADLLWAYRNDILEVLEAEEERNGKY